MATHQLIIVLPTMYTPHLATIRRAFPTAQVSSHRHLTGVYVGCAAEHVIPAASPYSYAQMSACGEEHGYEEIAEACWALIVPEEEVG